jgi:DNA (cytosine-5)-methyltransferase 1
VGIDLFAGAGGLSLGFEQAGFDVVAAVELDPIHCAVHEFNFPDAGIVCRSVEHTTADEIRAAAGVADRDIDVVFGGPPCQGFSLIGKRALDDPRNALVFHFLRLVLDLHPKYFIMENVAGLTLGDHKKFLLELIDAFVEGGYAVQRSYQVLNASDYGVPQDRRRLFLFGCREGLTLPQYPAPTCQPSGTRAGRRTYAVGLPQGPTVRDAIGDLPNPDHFHELADHDSVRAEYGVGTEYARRLRGLSSDPTDFAHPRAFNRDMLTSSLRTVHTAESMTRFAATPNGETESVSRFHKLDPDGICNTLRAGTPSNRGAFTSPRPIHPFSPRCITVREAARIHSYPDWFRFHVTKWHGFRQIGNSVPPLLGRAVAGEIAAVLRAKRSVPKGVMRLGDESLLRLNMSEAAARYSVSRHVIEPRTRSA